MDNFRKTWRAIIQTTQEKLKPAEKLPVGDKKNIDFTFHDLRHTFASRLVDKDIDLYVVKKLMGHSTITVTERYSHLRDDKLADAVARLDE